VRYLRHVKRDNTDILLKTWRLLLTNLTCASTCNFQSNVSELSDVKFPGMETFKGEMFHSARWNHNYDYQGKRMAVIGNGCSAAQIVPCVVKKAAFVTQYARSAQWYHERPNRDFTSLEKWCFKNVPLWERYLRLKQFLENDELVTTYMPGGKASKKRAKVEENAKKYIFDTSPGKYHHFLVPDFPLGMSIQVQEQYMRLSANEAIQVASVESLTQTTSSHFTIPS
jgi:cation diffusion facilitator CzcD-associated flavoprotein CzcO